MSFLPSDKRAPKAGISPSGGETDGGLGGLGVLASPATTLGDMVNPQLGQAMQLAGHAQALLGQAQQTAASRPVVKAPPAGDAPTSAPPSRQAAPKALTAAPALVEKLFIAAHPLAGQAVNDYATP